VQDREISDTLGCLALLPVLDSIYLVFAESPMCVSISAKGDSCLKLQIFGQARNITCELLKYRIAGVCKK
jgi:hypothetical protein